MARSRTIVACFVLFTAFSVFDRIAAGDDRDDGGVASHASRCSEMNFDELKRFVAAQSSPTHPAENVCADSEAAACDEEEAAYLAKCEEVQLSQQGGVFGRLMTAIDQVSNQDLRDKLMSLVSFHQHDLEFAEKIVEKVVYLVRRTEELRLAAQLGSAIGAIDNHVANDAITLDPNSFFEDMLVSAASTGNSEVVQRMIGIGADVDWQDVVTGNTALTVAVNAGSLDTVRLLLGAGADPNVASRTGPPLLHAATGGKLDIVDALLGADADVNARWDDGVTALYQAVRGRHQGTVDALLAANANVNVADTKGQTPLFIAVYEKHFALVETLLSANAELDAYSADEVSALGAAVSIGALDIVNLLLASGAGTEPPPRCERCIPPIFAAMVAKDVACVSALLDAGASLKTRFQGIDQLAFAKRVGDQAVIDVWLSARHRGVLGYGDFMDVVIFLVSLPIGVLALKLVFFLLVRTWKVLVVLCVCACVSLWLELEQQRQAAMETKK